MDTPKKPYLFTFPKIGASDIGYISVAESVSLPFPINRVYWTYYTPESIIRGRHAHHELEQILLAVSGRIIVHTEYTDQTRNEYILDNPYTALYLPPYYWHTLQFSHSAVLMAMCSMAYDEKDYIRNYDEFRLL